MGGSGCQHHHCQEHNLASGGRCSSIVPGKEGTKYLLTSDPQPNVSLLRNMRRFTSARAPHLHTAGHGRVLHGGDQGVGRPPVDEVSGHLGMRNVVEQHVKRQPAVAADGNLLRGRERKDVTTGAEGGRGKQQTKR